MMILLQSGINTVHRMAVLLLEPHIYRVLTLPLQSLSGLYLFLKLVDNGVIRVFGAFDGEQMVGACWGEFIEPGVFSNHSGFLRGVDAVKYSLEAERQLVKNFPETRLIVGIIPEHNRAALRYAKRCGYTDRGYELNADFINNDGVSVKCIRMEKSTELISWDS